MKVDSLRELEQAVAEWRRNKTYVREPMPEDLRARVRRGIKKHGERAVVRVTRVDPRRLSGPGRKRPKASPAGVRSRRGGVGEEPAAPFSRVTLTAPSAPNTRPLAEVERSGVTLRIFEPTPELMELLSAACGVGAPR